MDGSGWAARAHVLYPAYVPPSERSVLDELHALLRVIKAGLREKVLLLDSTSGRFFTDLLASAFFGLLPRRLRPAVVMMGAMWEPNAGLRHPVERLIVRLADRAIERYVVQSSAEMEIFPRTWQIDLSKLRCCLYFYTFDQERDLKAPAPPPGDYVFAGGNAQRDYEPLIEAARRMPERTFVIATSLLDNHPDLPPNVTARPVPHPEFVALMRSAAAVVVPMKTGLHRAAGQQTYLNAMLLGKPTIINDVLGVRDHVQGGVNALIVDSTPNGYVTALNWVFDPAHADAVARLCQEACRTASEQFTFENHVACLVSVMDEVVALHQRR